jgi:hypothetical protein
MGQLISTKGGKRSRVDVPNPVGDSTSQIAFADSTHYLPSLKLDLENGDSDLTQWEPQQLIATTVPKGTQRCETPRGRAKFSFPAHAIGKLQTTTQSGRINTDKRIAENVASLSSDRKLLLGDEKSITLSPTELEDTPTSGKEEDFGSVARSPSTKSRKQHNRKALIREVHQLLHSASLDDMSQIASYLKTHEIPMIPDCKVSHV